MLRTAASKMKWGRIAPVVVLTLFVLVIFAGVVAASQPAHASPQAKNPYYPFTVELQVRDI